MNKQKQKLSAVKVVKQSLTTGSSPIEEEENKEDLIPDAISSVAEEVILKEKNVEIPLQSGNTLIPLWKEYSVPQSTKFRLNIYDRKGSIRSSIPKEVYLTFCSKYGDIMRCISSSKWLTFDDILSSVWDLEKKLKSNSGHTRKSVLLAIEDMVSGTLVEIKSDRK